MNNIFRLVDTSLTTHFDKFREVLVLLGARQVGKTTILTRLFPHAQYFTADNETTKNNLESYDISFYKQIFSTNKFLILDEIHLLSDPGRVAKIIYDQMPDYKVIITGSSALDIKNKSSESLAGRKIDYHLYPLTFSEYLAQKQIVHDANFSLHERISGSEQRSIRSYNFDLANSLHKILVFGLYPSTLNHHDSKNYLLNLVDSVVLKDLLDLKLIDDRKAALETLKLLAYQTGQLVNYSEIAQRVGKDARTIKKYVQIFHQSYITFELLPFSQNSRDEIGKNPKIYFWDVGLRNALIGDFSDVSLRPDIGALFENFIISDFLKENIYLSSDFKANYWRTKSGSEVDLVLSNGKDLIGIEIKYSKGRYSQAFVNRYPHAKMKVITSENFY